MKMYPVKRLCAALLIMLMLVIPCPARSEVRESACDNDMMFEGYLESLFSVPGDAKFAPRNFGGDLTGAMKHVYDVLRPEFQKIAAGARTSTSFTLDIPWDTLSTDDYENVIRYIGLDLPYELYWYDYVEDLVFSQTSDHKTTIRMPVFKGFAAGEFQVDPTQVRIAREAVANARAIVDRYATLTDYEKLRAYKDEICRLTSYNYDGIGPRISAGNDPFGGRQHQLIWIFDGDPKTTVVCDGYARAFQYLCDLSDFAGNVLCYSVTGEATARKGRGLGAHMWNIVKMPDGKRYHVDVTWDDDDTAPTNQFFLRGSANGTPDEGYDIIWSDNGREQVAHYLVKAEYRTIYTSGDQTLSTEDYTASTGDIFIEASRFPDNALRSFIVRHCDKNGDNTLSKAEIEAVKELDLGYQGIASLEGLEVFTGLETLNCAGNALTTLDLSKFPSLNILNCASNLLSGLKFSKNRVLTYLNCANNPTLKSLDVTPIVSLKFLMCNGCGLETLNISKNSDLRQLYCDNNALTRLDPSGCKKLYVLVCAENRLTALDLKGLTDLELLLCTGNAFTELDLSSCGIKDYATISYLVSLDNGVVHYGEKDSVFRKYIYGKGLECDAGVKLISPLIFNFSEEPVLLPDGITEVAESAFEGCGAQVIILPRSCQVIHKRAFANCKNLKLLILCGSMSDISEDAFEGIPRLECWVSDAATYSNMAFMENIGVHRLSEKIDNPIYRDMPFFKAIPK